MKRNCLLIIYCLLSFAAMTQKPEFHKRSIKQIAEGIYLSYRPEPLRFVVEGNAVIIVNDNDVVVVESTGTPVGARELIAEIKKITSKPVTLLINTHGHGDHTLGNEEFVKAYPGIEIVAHSGTMEYFKNRGLNYVDGYFNDSIFQSKIKFMNDQIEKVEKEKLPGYEKVLANLKQYRDHDVYVRRAAYKEVKVVYPTMSFNDSLTIHRGDREIQLLFLGKGDTKGDAWVYLPKEKILMSGDAVVHPTPYGYSQYPVEWLATLKKAATIDFNILIPGHGEVQYNKEHLLLITSLLQSIYDQTKKAVDEGLTVEQTVAKINIAEIEMKITKDDPILRYFFDLYFKQPAFTRMYNDVLKRKQTN